MSDPSVWLFVVCSLHPLTAQSVLLQKLQLILMHSFGLPPRAYDWTEDLHLAER